MIDTPASRHLSPAGLPIAGFALLAAVTVLWGVNWPTMKVVLGELSPWWFRTICLVTGGAALLVISGLSGNRVRVPASDQKWLVLCSVFNMVGWHLFSALGLTLVAAGRASIIAFTMPVWAALFAIPVLRERVSLAVFAGLALGMAGLAILIGHDMAVVGAAPIGSLFMLGAAVSWGLGTVLFKRFDWQTPVASVVGWQLLLASIPVAVGALMLEPLPDLAGLSAPALFAFAYVLVFPMVFCQWAYFKIVNMFPAVYAAIGVLAVPVVGVFSSQLLLGEPVGWRETAALVLVCSSIFTVLILPKLRS